MKVVFCVMKKSELVAIYADKTKAENIAKQMTSQHQGEYYVETRAVI